MRIIRKFVRDVQMRQQRQWLWQCVSAGLLAGGAIGTLASLLRILTEGSISGMWVAAGVLVPVVAAVCVAIGRSTSIQLAARTIDNQCGLKDRTQTALQFLASSDDSALHRLQVQDAETHLQSVDPVQVAPIHAPKTWGPGILLAVIACGLSFFAVRSEQVHAAPENNAVVISQAEFAAKGLEDLEQFQQQQNDPELEKVLKELARQLTELKTPGLEPKEALAKLSEMDAAIQELRQQLTEASLETELKKVGEALSLSEAMAAAGEALANGDLEKAAEEIRRLEMPELDRKTTKAVQEKLDKIQNSKGDSRPQQDLKESLRKVSEGMSSGDKDKFQEGMQGLADASKKQSQKTKLSEMLRKQSQNLSESKSAIESEGRAQAQSNRKGGQKAGQGNADLNDNKTAKQKTGSEMKLKGEDSGSGDSDLETEKGPEQEQEVIRKYRQNIDKYEALRESVLDSESIPLGHRQTIRRYFELIRPTNSEIDRVNIQMDAAPKND